MLLAMSFAIPGDAQTQPMIRLGITRSDAFSEGYYAQQVGFFKRAGLTVQIVPFRTGKTVITGVSAGSIDIGVSNIFVLAEQISRGAQIVFLAGAGMYSTHAIATALIVANHSQMRIPSDFVGKTIAVVALGDQTHIGMLNWLDQNHVNSSSVHFIGLPFGEMAGAVANGLADAAVITEPWLSATLRSGRFSVFTKPYDAIAPQFLLGVWFTTRQWYAKHTGVAQRFVKTIYKTARWANGHQDQTGELLAQLSKVNVRAIRSMVRSPYSTSLDPALIQPQLDLASKYDMISQRLNASDFIVKSDK